MACVEAVGMKIGEWMVDVPSFVKEYETNRYILDINLSRAFLWSG